MKNERMPPETTRDAMNNGRTDKKISEIVRAPVKEFMESLLKGEIQAFLDQHHGQMTGYYERDPGTRYGKINDLRMPGDRDNAFQIAIFDRYQRNVGIDDLVVSMYSKGVSTRKMAEILEELFHNRYSKSTIFRLLQKRYFAIFMDATFFSLRKETVQKECVIFTMGIKERGQYEILGFYMNPIENHIAYRNVLMELHERGLEEPLLFIADGLPGIGEEIMQIYPRSDLQLCTVYASRNFESHVRVRDRDEIREMFLEVSLSLHNFRDALNETRS